MTGTSRVARLLLWVVVVSSSRVASAKTLSQLFEQLVFHLPTDSPAQSHSVAAPFEQALASSVAKAVPLLTASPGFVYSYDLGGESENPFGVPTKREEILGQLFLERAETIGYRHLSVSMAWEQVAIDEFDGHELDHLSDNQLIEGAYTIPRLRIALETNAFDFNFTYGVTPDFDINAVVPVLFTHLGLDQQVRFVTLGLGEVANDHESASASATGVGDWQLRGKYRLPDVWGVETALGLQLRLPTGSQDDFQGTGEFELSPMLYASWRELPLTPFPDLVLQPYFNLGVDVVAADAGRSEGRWGVGADIRAGQRVGIGAAVLGRDAFERIAPEGLFDRERFDPKTGRITTEPLFGITGGRPDIVDFAIGGRINLHPCLLLFANVIIPLNDDGFRSSIVPVVGVEIPLTVPDAASARARSAGSGDSCPIF